MRKNTYNKLFSAEGKESPKDIIPIWAVLRISVREPQLEQVHPSQALTVKFTLSLSHWQRDPDKEHETNQLEYGKGQLILCPASLS